jgi:hypothetical protein
MQETLGVHRKRDPQGARLAAIRMVNIIPDPLGTAIR